MNNLIKTLEDEARSIRARGQFSPQFVADLLSQAADTLSSRSEAEQRGQVWIAESKTTFIVFATEDDAKRYMCSFPASIGGGIRVYPLSVHTTAPSLNR